MAESVTYVTEGGPPHPYHMVRPSPWPLLSSLAAGLLAVGGLRAMHGAGTWLFYLGLAAVLGSMFGWWRDVVRESVKEKAHTPVVKLGLRFGVSLFIASEVMFFVAFFWAFFDLTIFPKVVPDYNPEGLRVPPSVHVVDPFDLPLFMTLLLLLSGTAVTWAHAAAVEGKTKELVQGLLFSVILGVVFTGVQAYEYAHLSFGISDGHFPSAFYMATGFHGLHVLIGTIFLAVCYFRARKGHFTPKSHVGLEGAAWYWHFVDVVWLFLFVAIYWWGGLGAVHAAH